MKIEKQFQLNADTINSLEDVKKILAAMHVRIYEDNPFFSEVEKFFNVEVIPKGYLKLLEIMEEDELKHLSREEILEKCNALVSDE
tara:strand:- start:1275 stop:1532 length:258 start_codon:yes stop_codon:yes gene_type:complete